MSRFHSPSAFVFYGLFAFLIVATILAYALIRKGKVGGETAANLTDRIWAWWVMIGVLALVFTLGATAMTIFFALCSMAALREFATITHTGRADHDALAIAFYVVLPLQYLLIWLNVPIFAALLIPVYCFLLLPVVTVFKGEVAGFLTRVSETQWGLMICVYCVSHIPAILQLDIPGYRYSSFTLVAWLILVVQASDVLQYVWGKSLGRHKLAPRVSPSKTVEGLAGALEDHRLGDPEVADGAGGGVDVQREALHPGVVVQRAAAGAAVGQAPPFVAVGVVVDVGEEPDPAVVDAGAARQVERGPVDGEAIDEGGGGAGGAGEQDAEGGGECLEFHVTVSIGVIAEDPDGSPVPQGLTA